MKKLTTTIIICVLSVLSAGCQSVTEAPWTITYSDGAVYTGGYNNWTEQEGRGTMRWANGDSYTGEWSRGEPQGLGTYTWSSGDKYNGNYESGIRHGAGKFSAISGQVYEGRWSYGQLVGANTEGLPKEQDAMFGTGNKISMEWAGAPCALPPYCSAESSAKGASASTSNDAVATKPTSNTIDQSIVNAASLPANNADDTTSAGQTINYSDGSVYEGEVKNGSPHGRGVYKFADGSNYVGDFVDGRRHGRGTMTHSNGDLYLGDFASNLRHGQGRYRFADGNVHVGEWRNGQQHGQGTLSFADGAIEEGVWENGQRSNPDWQNARGFSVPGILSGPVTVIPSTNNDRQSTSTSSRNTNAASRNNNTVSQRTNFNRTNSSTQSSSSRSRNTNAASRNNNTVSQRTNSNRTNSSSQSSSSRIYRNKSTCSSYGFTPNTDGHAQCVMYLSEGIRGQSESQIASSMRQSARIQQQQNQEIIAIQLEQQRYLAEVERQRQLNASLGLMQLGLAIFTGQRPSAATPIIPPPSSYSAFRTCRYSYGRDIAQYSIPSNQICPLNSSVDGMTGFLTR